MTFLSRTRSLTALTSTRLSTIVTHDAHRVAGALVTLCAALCLTAASAGTNGSVHRDAEPAVDRVTLSGRVLGPDGRPIAGATVTLRAAASGLEQGAQTDEQGRYRFQAIIAGSYVISATLHDSLHSAARELHLEPPASPSIDLTLDRAIRNEQVVVTAGDHPQRTDEVAKAITVIDKAEIDERNEFSIAEVLRTVPGLQVTNSGGPGQLTQLRFRGLRTDSGAVLIDGFRFRDPASTQADATGFISNLNVVNLDRLEVLRGSASSLYGTNAVGGTLNIVSQTGQTPTQGDLQFEGGQLGLVRERATIDGATNANRVRYSAGVAQLNVTHGVDGHDATRSTDGQGTIAVQLAAATMLTGRIWGSDGNVDLNVSPSTSGIPGANINSTGVVEARALPPDQVQRLLAGQSVNYGDATFIPNLDDPDYTRDSSFFTGALALTHQASDRVSLRASYQRLRTNRQYVNGPGGIGFQPTVANFSEYTGTTDTADVRANFEINTHLLVTGGYEFEREGYFDHQDDHLPTLSRVNEQTRISQRAHTVFGQANWSGAGDRLHIAVAGRAQAFSLSRPQFSPSASVYAQVPIDAPPSALTGDLAVTYLVSSGDTSGAGSGIAGINGGSTKLRAHVGNAYRAPSLYERFGGGFYGDATTGFVSFSPYGDPLLKPDRYVSADFGIDQGLARERVQLHATYFHTNVQQISAFDFSGGIDPATDPYGRFVGYVNGAGGRSRGLELSGDLRPSSSLSIGSSYTFTDSKTDNDVAAAGFFRTVGVARHTFTLTATQRIGARLDIHGVLYAVGERFAALYAGFDSRAYAFPGYAKLDVGASYNVPLTGRRSLRIYGKVDNLLDQRYYELGWLAPGAMFVGGVTVRY